MFLLTEVVILMLVATGHSRDCPGVAIKSTKSGDFGGKNIKITSSCQIKINAPQDRKFIILAFRETLMHDSDSVTVHSSANSRPSSVPKNIRDVYLLLVKANATIDVRINNAINMKRSIWGFFNSKNDLYVRIDVQDTHGSIKSPDYVVDPETPHLNFSFGFVMKNQENDYAVSFRKADLSNDRVLIGQKSQKAIRKPDLTNDYIFGPEFSIELDLDLTKQGKVELEYRAVDHGCSKQIKNINATETIIYEAPLVSTGETVVKPEPYECLILVHSSPGRITGRVSSTGGIHCAKVDIKDGASTKARLLQTNSLTSIQPFALNNGKLWLSIKGLKPIPNFKLEIFPVNQRASRSPQALLQVQPNQITSCVTPEDPCKLESMALLYIITVLTGVVSTYAFSRLCKKNTVTYRAVKEPNV